MRRLGTAACLALAASACTEDPLLLGAPDAPPPPADLTGPGLDLAAADASVASDLMHACQAPAPVASYSAPNELFDVVTADFDGDGSIDFAVVGFAPNEVSVFLNDGCGGFTAVRSPLMTQSPDAIAAGDIDGDGKVDLVFGNIPGWVTVFLNRGNGSFQAAGTYPIFGTPESMAVGDLDGDGRPEVIVGDGYLEVLPNLGGGVLGATQRITACFSPNSVTVSDLDRDGHVDIAHVCGDQGGGAFEVHLNDGHGAFPTATDYAGACVGTFVGSTTVTDLAVGDLDGDGWPDIACAGGERNAMVASISLHINQRNGTFAPPVYQALTNVPFRSVAIADLDGDGRGDLALEDGGDIVILLDSASSYRPLKDYQAGVANMGFALADVNGDGRPDVLAPGENAVVVLLNHGDGSFY
jgi:hypothetical protein